MYNNIVIYEKPNGKIIYRATKYDERKEVGDTNSYGWKVVGVQKIRNGICYSEKEYNTLLQHRKIRKNIGKFIINIVSDFDAMEAAKWLFIGYIVLKLCQQ